MHPKLTFAANSTPIVVRLRGSTPREPMEASAYASSPHNFKHFSTLGAYELRSEQFERS
jgi:hypothetical protein